MKWKMALATLGVAGLAGLIDVDDAAAQQINLQGDTRNVRTMGADSGGIHSDRQAASHGQTFGDWIWTQGNHGGAVSAQGSAVVFDPGRSDWFALGARLENNAYLSQINPSDPETHYADQYLDVTISTSVPLHYNASVEIDQAGRSGGYVRGIGLSEVSPGVFQGSGTLSPGQHRVRAWGYASTNLIDIHDLSDLTASTLVEGGHWIADMHITGVAGHVAPTPAAVGPGLAMLGMLLMRRRKGRAERLCA